MTTARLRKPLDYCDEGQFPVPSPDAPEVARHLLDVTARIIDLVDEHGVRAMAREIGVAHSGVSRIVTGELWPSSATISALEQAYRLDLWRG